MAYDTPHEPVAARDSKQDRKHLELAIPFDQLPNEAFVRLPVVLALTARSRAAAYADAATGRFPPFEKIGERSAGIRVGELRRFLADPTKYRAPVTA